jgi:dihydroorotate dehydrogenase (fumarate)
MVDLTTSWLGLPLRNPLVASASAISKKNERVKALEDAGIGAVVMYSLFEEEIYHESKALNYYLEAHTYSFPEALTWFPEFDHYNLGPEKYLGQIETLKKQLHIPIIGSLNGSTGGGWVKYAKKIEDAGADALELNIYYIPTDPNLEGSVLEQAYLDLVSNLRSTVKIPLSVKLTPFHASMPNFTMRLVENGANGLVMFNRFFQPDLNIEDLTVEPHLELSTSADLLLPLRWIAILYGKLKTDFALTSGIHTTMDVVKAIMAGANITMMASELIHNGTKRVGEILKELEAWMVSHEYESVIQMRGVLSQQKVAEPGAFERANYMKALTSFDNRIRKD